MFTLLFSRKLERSFGLDTKWTQNQKERAQILFELHPDIKTAYNLTQQLLSIYNYNNNKKIAMTKLAHWYRKIEESEFKNFNIVLNTITFNYQSILNYFENRSTNASAESFNAKIKALDLSLEVSEK